MKKDEALTRRHLVPLASLAAIFALALHIFAFNVADSDLFWHIRLAEDALRDGRLPRHDVYGYTSSIPFMNYEWGAGLIYALVARLVGFSGLLWLKMAVALAMFGLLCAEARRARASIVVFVVTAALFLMTVRAGFSVRAQNFTYLFFALEVVVHRRILSGASSIKLAWIFPPLFLLWANLHGGVVVGGAVLALLCMTALMSDELTVEQKQVYAAAVAAAGLATCVTPWGPRGLVALIEHVIFSSRPGNYEFDALSWWPPDYWQANLTLVLAALAMWVTPLRRRTDELALLAVTALFTQLAQRNGPFLAIAAFAVLPAHLEAWRQKRRGTLEAWRARRTGGLEEPPPPRILAELTAGLLVLIAVGLVWLNGPRIRNGLEVRPDVYPVGVVKWMREHRVSGNVAVFMNWGGYVLSELAPAVKVSGDGRYEWVYSEQVIRDNWAFVAGLPGSERILTAYPTDLALVNLAWPEGLEALKRQPGWREVYREGPAALWALSPGLERGPMPRAE